MRLVSVSLREVPEPVRRRAARPLLLALADDGGLPALRESVELERAIAFPSGRRYMLPADVVAKVLP